MVRARGLSPDDTSIYARMARFLVLGYATTESGGAASLEPKLPKKQPKGEEGDGPADNTRPPFVQAMLLGYCTVGLMGAYLLWGVLQERIMSTTYETGRFESSNFLVFSNRVFALLVAIPMIIYKNEGLGKAPFYKYALTSLSNTLSSWCQLESLKFLSFPVQVLAKSSKLVPVMIMGKVLSGKRYPWYEYIIAIAVAGGVSLFLMAQTGGGKKDDVTTEFSGIFLMLGYLSFDSFTSQWQDLLFKEYGLSSYQMMFGINSFSAIVTLVSLLQSGELFSSLDFLYDNPEAAWHVAGFSLAGAIGQTFIFLTIKEFGPLLFTLITTLRQLIAIILSVIIYGHSVTPLGMFGACIVFFALGYRVWKKEQETKEAKEASKRAKSSEHQHQGDIEEEVPLKEGKQVNGSGSTKTTTINNTLLAPSASTTTGGSPGSEINHNGNNGLVVGAVANNNSNNNNMTIAAVPSVSVTGTGEANNNHN
jgi:adenosine 3'-phospho 5'-phosphosulfate transporter B2